MSIIILILGIVFAILIVLLIIGLLILGVYFVFTHRLSQYEEKDNEIKLLYGIDFTKK